MGMEVVLVVILMSVVLRTTRLISIVCCGRSVSQNARSVQEDTTLVMMVHVWHVHHTHAVQETLTLPLPQIVPNAQMTKQVVIHA